MLVSVGALFRLPELGLIDSNGLANPRDFLAPVAAWEDKARTEVISKFMGGLWATQLPHPPLDTVAWHGTCTAYKYELARFAMEAPQRQKNYDGTWAGFEKHFKGK